MSERDLTLDTSSISMEEVVQIAYHEVSINSNFSIEQTGSVTDNNVTIRSSMNTVNIHTVGNEIRVSIDATDKVADAVEQALKSQSGSTSLDADIPQSTGRVSSEVSPRDIQDEQPLYIVKLRNRPVMIINQEAWQGLDTDNIERVISDRVNAETAVRRFTDEVGERPTEDDLMFPSEISDPSRSMTVANEQPDMGRSDQALGGARATELLPDDAELRGTFRVYDNGMVVADIDDMDKEMYETSMGLFFGGDYGIAQGYTHDNLALSQRDFMETVRALAHLVEQNTNMTKDDIEGAIGAMEVF